MNNHEFILTFEKMIAEYAGSKYAVAVNSCSNAIFLSLMYINEYSGMQFNKSQELPLRTYASVPMALHHAGFDVSFRDYDWEGIYRIGNLPIIDGAQRFTEGMYEKGTLHCLSFQQKKILKLGHGGMILTDDEEAASILRRMAFDGRDYSKYISEDDITIFGYHMNITPNEAAEGILKLNELRSINRDNGGSRTYIPLTNFTLFKDFKVNA